MAIRLRVVEGVGLIAICAARSVPKEGDVYLDDRAHHALTVKFEDDWKTSGDERDVAPNPGVEDRRPMLAAMDAEESNNPNREWWDREYGSIEGGKGETEPSGLLPSGNTSEPSDLDSRPRYWHMCRECHRAGHGKRPWLDRRCSPLKRVGAKECGQCGKRRPLIECHEYDAVGRQPGNRVAYARSAYVT